MIQETRSQKSGPTAGEKSSAPTARTSSCAGELSTDEVNKIETVLNNSCQFKIPAHMLNRNRSAHDITVAYNVTDKESFDSVKAWMGKIDKHVSDGVNKFLVENQRDVPGGVVHR